MTDLEVKNEIVILEKSNHIIKEKIQQTIANFEFKDEYLQFPYYLCMGINIPGCNEGAIYGGTEKVQKKARLLMNACDIKLKNAEINSIPCYYWPGDDYYVYIKIENQEDEIKLSSLILSDKETQINGIYPVPKDYKTPAGKDIEDIFSNIKNIVVVNLLS